MHEVERYGEARHPGPYLSQWNCASASRFPIIEGWRSEVICLQETRLGRGELKAFELRNPGYRIYHSMVAEHSQAEKAGKGVCVMVSREVAMERDNSLVFQLHRNVVQNSSIVARPGQICFLTRWQGNCRLHFEGILFWEEMLPVIL